MRFITWPTLTNSFIVFIGILPSLIPAVNAIVGNVNFVSPSSGGDTFYIGQESEIIWNFNNANVGTTPGMIDLTGDVCDLYLVDTTNGFNQPLATGVPLVDSPTFVTGSVVITYDQPGLIPGSNYVIDMESESIGSWKSSPFTIASH
ncbi:hypothetical protein BJV77DRAFT_1007973 [Russula vinacea]|nr:hypothetical protein BJV77DRAFT_1007973 [Russula vinacea]